MRRKKSDDIPHRRHRIEEFCPSWAVIAAAVLVIAAVFEPKIAAAGWLVGFTFWARILLGSLTLAMIHRLTSGRWANRCARNRAGLRCSTAPDRFAIPVFVAIPVLYPWVHGAPGTTKHEVLLYYLNVPSYIARSMVALLGWSALALLLPRTIGAPVSFWRLWVSCFTRW